MIKLLRRLLVVAGFVFGFRAMGQQYLRPGFDGAEYRDLLRVEFAPSADSSLAPRQYVFQYRSAELGMRNRWALWVRRDRSDAVIAIRGTIGDPVSWLENFYAAQVPATGALQLSDSVRFDYRLASDGRAMVHVGWLLGLAYLAPSIVQQIRAAYAGGIHEFILFGHSQGAAIAFLTRSYLYYLQQKGELPADIYFKTYCSAAPKPGNTYYAYDYDFITRGGWGMTVVNGADWVPETPFSLQTMQDMNALNPFVHLDKALARMSLIKRWYVKGKYHRLRRRALKSATAFRRVLGDLVYKQVRGTLAGWKPPAYGESMNYQRAGTPVVLEPDSTYYRLFPNDPEKVFQHHGFGAYDWLVAKYY